LDSNSAGFLGAANPDLSRSVLPRGLRHARKNTTRVFALEVAGVRVFLQGTATPWMHVSSAARVAFHWKTQRKR
jgi:hypothetical protein